MTRSPITRLLHETLHFLLGLIALAALTALCFWLDFGLVSTAFTYLILIVVLSLAVAFIPLVVLSFIAVGCLNFFFAPPIFSFRVDYPADIITIAAFLITSLIVTSLVRRTRAAKDALANVVDGIPALIWNTSPDGSADFSNQRFRDYTGFSSEQLRGRGWLDALHPEDRKVEELRAAFAAGEPFENEVRIRSANGDYRWFVLRMTPLRNKQGTIVKWYGAASDVTDRRRAEYLTQQVFERSPDLVGILGRDYRYRRANPMYETFWGIAPEKVVGMHIRDVIGEERFDRFAKPNLDRCFSGEEASYEGWFNGPGGRKYWFVTYSPLRLESERVEAVLIIARDLTERMLASEKLRDARMQLAHANRVATVGELTASIAHEVNQPIGALVTNAHAALRMLKAEPPDLDQTRDALGDIINDGRRVSEVIDRIRALVKKEPPQADRVDVNEAIVDSIALTRAEIQKSGVSLETLMKDLPPILGDRVQFQQVVMNLVMNAIEAMSAVDEGTRELQIVTGQEGEDQIFVTVRDSGPTLKPESLDRFFEAFYSTKSHGMGIGLSICRSIIEAHGGRIWATANVPRGATLHITLPASREALCL